MCLNGQTQIIEAKFIRLSSARGPTWQAELDLVGIREGFMKKCSWSFGFCPNYPKWHRTGPIVKNDDYWRSVLWAAHGHFCNKSESDWKTAKDIFIGGKLAPCDSRLIDRFALRTPIAYKQPIKTDSQAIHLYLGQRSNKHPISSCYFLRILNIWQNEKKMSRSP